MNASKRRRRVLALIALVVLLAAGVVAYFVWFREPRLPKPGEPRYEEYAAAFQVGTAQLDSGLTEGAEPNLTKAIKLVPQEPAGWANRGLLYLRDGKRLKEAAADVATARKLAPDSAAITEIAAHLAERQGKVSEALALARQAAEADPGNVQLLWKVSELLIKEGEPGADAERLKVLDRLLEFRPTSLPVLREYASVAVAAKNKEALLRSLDQLSKLAPGWRAPKAPHEPDPRKLLAQVRKAAEGPLDARLRGQIGSLQNVLMLQPGYARSAEEIRPKDAQVGHSLQQFLKLSPLRTAPDEPDLALTFAPAERRWAAEAKGGGWESIFPVWLVGNGRPAVFVANATEVRRADDAGPVLKKFPGGPKNVPPSLAGVVPIDWNEEPPPKDKNAPPPPARTDILLAGAGGLRFYQQKPDGTFEDVTARTKLSDKVLGDDYFGAWAVDIDLDGDLDLVVARRDGPPLLLRNNFDGTWKEMDIFPGVKALRAFAWLDLDNDGAADAALLDRDGGLHVFMNQRSGQFTRREVPDAKQRYHALAVADVNDDGVFDLIAVEAKGKLLRLSDKEKGSGWDVAELGDLQKPPAAPPGELRLVAADLDNNGAIDLILRTPAGGVAWLADGKGAFKVLPDNLPAGVADVVDLDGKGELALIGFTDKSEPQVLTARGTKGYHFLQLQPRAATGDVGDARINPFALGSEVELRTGVLVTKQPIDRPTVHFGLGSRNRVDLFRFVWTNGALQYEFDRPGDAPVPVVQRLSASCPFLYTWDGEKVAFVADFCWSTPLGMYINAQDKGGFLQTTDWVKIRGSQLRPRDGLYDVRVNANLWETHFLDQLGLIVVDHPPGTEMHVDERFFLQPTKPQVYLTGPSSPVYRAWDHKGADVTDIVRAVDGRYLDHCCRGTYQGVTKDHWVEVDLGDEAPKTGPAYLLAHGWIHPTDSSINFAMEQGKHVKPMPLTLEVPDGKDGWKAAGPPLGFPAGKNKTCVIRLDGVAGKGVARRFRLRTNLEVFWDALHYARGLDADQCKQQSLPIKAAELRYRGIVRMSQASRSAPEVPHYEDVEHTGQPWRDLIGYHTRFGDVKELLDKVDDRYVILNAGDEIAFTFAAPPGPEKGWQRDFVWVSDGWVKDGNLNTRWGKTVLPLPYHGMASYDAPPRRLEDDPVYKRFPKDWEVFHTRYVTPSLHERGLRTFRRPR